MKVRTNLQSSHVDNSTLRRPHYYLPHHGVLKPDSSTTKLRVVFNGSSASSTGYSLNDLMHAGPNLMLNLFDLLIWIRRRKYLFATDITKMYRQIKIHPDDWDFQRILWVDEQLKESHLQLTTVTYGTKAAVRTLLQLVEDEGSNSVGKLIQTAHQLIRLCHAGGFPLAKWHSTSNQLLAELSSESGEDSGISFDDCDTKILGIRWSSQQDTFNFSAISPTHSNRFSKRLVLSEVAQIFDPLGFAAPVVIKAKMFLRSLWLHTLNWDDALPEPLITQWLSIRQDLTSLARLSIARWFNTFADSTVELHCFADASQFAMGAVVYLTVNSPSTGANVSLVCSKTKVAPLKRLTIPRLELSAALLLSTLLKHVYATLNMTITNVHLWTDSQVTLKWIKAHPSRWKDYVRNRVTKIQELTETAHWRHVPGTSNPADCASRGITTDQLEEHSLWWTGPSWMTQSEDSWPAQTDEAPNDICAQEARASVAHHAFSTLNKLLRITSLCSRAIKRLSRRIDSTPAVLISAANLEDSRLFWIKATQAAFFKEELALLSRQSHLPSSHLLSRLTAFIDNEGMLRVGGRLKRSELSYDTKLLWRLLDNSIRLSEVEPQSSLISSGVLYALATGGSVPSS
ncbi:uncharacterized protein LOC122518863 [Polistes fuscatus]|uniref:uncharacterized protein LOC122518863 n=1 Tax=Polistes fuscatus TaxID=30207 RepID=UPI001CA98D9D|nr:uncharacterized protein LOC122518863 [Polistes fuscatus]